MRNAEREALEANIASLGDQLEQLEAAQEEDPLEGGSLGLWPEEEGEPGEGLAEILAALEAGEELSPEQVAELEEAAEGVELAEELVERVKRGEVLGPGDLALLKAALGGEGAGELKAAEKVAAAIIERSLQGVNRQDAVPLLGGLGRLNRGSGLVRKRYDSWAQAREDTSPDDGLVSLFSPGPEGRSLRVGKALPASLELLTNRLGGEEQLEEEDDLLRLAVSKVAAGEPLSEAEALELLAENQKRRPLSLTADMAPTTVHRSLVALNPRRPVESTCLQETLMEIRRMVRNEREDIVLNKPLRAGARGDLVRKSLSGVLGSIFGQRE